MQMRETLSLRESAAERRGNLSKRPLRTTNSKATSTIIAPIHGVCARPYRSTVCPPTIDPSAMPTLKAAIFRPEAMSTAPGYTALLLHHIDLQTRHVAEGENAHHQHCRQRGIVNAGGQLEDQQQHQRGEDKLQRGDGAMLGQLPPTLPIATETPWPSRIQLTADGLKPASSCIIGARKVKR